MSERKTRATVNCFYRVAAMPQISVLPLADYINAYKKPRMDAPARFFLIGFKWHPHKQWAADSPPYDE